MKKSFVVIGLGCFGINVVKGLVSLHGDLLAIDREESPVKAAGVYTDNAVIADGTNKAALEELGVKSVDHAIVAIGDDIQSTILTVLNLRELGVKNISVRVDANEFKDVMLRLGATEVVMPEEASALALANKLISDTVEYYKVEQDYSMIKITVPDSYDGKSLVDLDLRKKFEVNIMGITRDGEFFQPKPNDKFAKGDILTVFGQDKQVTKFNNSLK